LNEDFELNENVILSHFDDFDRRIRCICKMINIINMQNLSQENVSCLNTTLVVLMLANKKDQLPKYLKGIKMKSIENTSTSTAGLIDPLTNFKDLLLFWQSHYLQKDKDCIGLEQVIIISN
jgi:Trpc4-associated protein